MDEIKIQVEIDWISFTLYKHYQKLNYNKVDRNDPAWIFDCSLSVIAESTIADSAITDKAEYCFMVKNARLWLSTFPMKKTASPDNITVPVRTDENKIVAWCLLKYKNIIQEFLSLEFSEQNSFLKFTV